MIPSICWDPVTTDCHGDPKVVTVYAMEQSFIDVVGSQLCISDDPLSGDCPVYLVEPFALVQATESPCWPEARSPGLGEVELMRTTAIDVYGMPDSDCT